MRWQFADPHDSQENAEREKIVARMHAWWQSFADRQSELQALFTGQSEWDLAEWMESTLQAVSPNLMWEYGPGPTDDTNRLIITPEADRYLRPLVHELFRLAPPFPSWEFHGHRLAEPLEEVIETVNGICGSDLSQTLVEARRDKHRRIALTYHCPDCKQVDEEQAQFASFVATEALLGEALLDRWIGSIQIVPLTPENKKENERAWSLPRMKPTVQAIVGSMLDQLAEQACFRYVPSGRWCGYELRPEAKSDYCGRSDLFSAVSGRPDVFESHQNGAVFYSDTHSSCGETFCYLKIDALGIADQDRSRFREQVERALNQAFIPTELGCVIGGGTGLRYSYIDLALLNVQRVLPTIRQIAQQFNFPVRSWLLFCDDELAEEWIPLLSNTPAPLK